MLHSNGNNDMRHIVFKIDEKDTFEFNEADYVVDLTSKDDYHHTFYNTLRPLYRMANFFQDEALDLFYISLMVYYADRKVLRKEFSDNWTREFTLYIPVVALDKWEKNKTHLEQMISYLSGDIWHINFRKRELNIKEKKISDTISNRYTDRKFDPDKFCMLSGGLDSFIGAADLLLETKNIAFIGHYGGGKGVKPFQDAVNEILKERFDLNDHQFFNFNATPVKGVEDSTRTRSLMFFAHAIILASCNQREVELYIPENGLISLNIPLTNSRLGSSSTRTTHPYYMNMLQELLNNLGLKIKLCNPYQFKTKGEMMKLSPNKDFISENYHLTMSCSHPDQGRYQKLTKPSHCGTCLPCTIRRASINMAFGGDNTDYRDIQYKEPKAIIELRSFRIGMLDYENKKMNRFTIQFAGQINDNLDEYISLYERGMKELGDFLNLQNE
ncbi:Qat anti-phage system QueC-like protein QatC [Sphingobacterium anhuiense]|uniref:Qat anti-phage system QueC-like protein QatC n=1 Tax=Sphingobacterium anhuiense TaxID=493780 RepID=A0ABW5YV02_9SPHI